MTLRTKTSRICAGEYEVRCLDGIGFNRTVRITLVEYPNDGRYWIAAASWDHSLYTDPLQTKRDAVFNARIMLKESLT